MTTKGVHVMDDANAPSGARYLRRETRLWEHLRLLAVASRLIDTIPIAETSDGDIALLVSAWLSEMFNRKQRDDALYARLGEHLWLMREVFLPEFVANYMPEDMRANLVADGWLRRTRPLVTDVAGSDDPVQSVKRILGFLKDGSDERGAMVAARDLSLAYHSLKLMSRLRYWETTRSAWWDKATNTANLRNRTFRLFESRQVVGPERHPVRLRTAHDSYDNHCVGIVLDRSSTEFLKAPSGHAPVCRFPTEYDLITVYANGVSIPALMRTRYKGVVYTVSKTFELHYDASWKLADIAGVAILYRDIADLKAGSSAFRRQFGSGSGEKIRLSADSTPVNPFADPGFLVVAHHASEGDSESRPWRVYEVQHTLARLDVDRQVSLAPINTKLYHLRRHTGPDGIFPQMFPPIDWASKTVRDALELHVRMSITF